MNTAAPIQTRFVLLLGIVAALGLAAFMVMRGGLVGGDETTSPVSPVAATPATAAKTPAKAAATPAKLRAAKAAPKIVLNAGLPANLARQLRREPVVVAAVFAPGAGDLGAVAQARTGAREVGAGFVTLNALNEKHARAIESLAGTISSPAVLVFKRPGVVKLRLDGFADSTLVAQAAQNAGARARAR